MPEEEIDNIDQGELEEPSGDGEGAGNDAPARRRFFSLRNFGLALGGIAILGVLVALVTIVSYRAGVFDDYIKQQFVARMAEIGMVFDADVFRVTASPLSLEIKNATFTNKVTGEKLFFVRDADLELNIENLYAWQLSRDISIDKTIINGAEAWITFDEQGRSNFAELEFIEDEAGSRVNLKYDSVDFSLTDSVVHFGDLSRSLSGNARNVFFQLTPVDRAVDEDDPGMRYKFELTSTDSNFIYDNSAIENIGLRVAGVVHGEGAEISTFELRTPIGESYLTGSIKDWSSPAYSFDVRSSVDLTQASSILPIGTSLVGVGNFKGTVTGHGETYRIEGVADTESLRAAGVSLKGVNIAATVAGTNSAYEANGTAIARLLTFDDFRVDFLKLVGNVRGTGTDFRWLGELEAVAARTGSMTLGGLFLSDALAEYKDQQLRTEAGTARARRFAIGDTEFADLTARNLRVANAGNVTSVSSPSAQARSLTVNGYTINGLAGRDVRVKNAAGRTDVNINGLRASGATVGGAQVGDLTADRFDLTDLPSSLSLTATNLNADRVNADGTIIRGLELPSVSLEDTKAETVIYAGNARVASIDTGSAAVGSLNIAGVRLTVREGRVTARSEDVNAGTVTLAKTDRLPSGGTVDDVVVSRPVFILEPSGRYRATADMSLGGGALGSVGLGAATARVEISNDRVALNDLNARIMEGSLNGNAVIGYNQGTESSITGTFSDLDISKLLALQGGRVMPIEGQTTGSVDLTFAGTNFNTVSGTINADIDANAGSAASGAVPVTGKVRLAAANGLFTVEAADLTTPASTFTASGRFDLKDNGSDLALNLRSADASEVDRIIRLLGVSPDLESQMDSLEVQLGGKLSFAGTVTGNLSDPVVDGRASLDQLIMRGREVGSVAADVSVSPTGFELRNGTLSEPGGGTATFAVNKPAFGTDNTSVQATLSNINAANLLAALPFSLPAEFSGQTSGTVDITGLPNTARGEVNLSAARGDIAGQSFDNFNVKAVFNGTKVDLERAEIRVGTGNVAASGSFDRASQAFNIDTRAKDVPLSLLIAFVPNSQSLPLISGEADVTAKAAGVYDRPSTYDINFSGISTDLQINQSSMGEVAFSGQTVNGVLSATLTATLDGQPQLIVASINFTSDDLPFVVATDFKQSPISPFLAFVPQLSNVPITGTATGRVEFGGNLSQVNANGERVFSAAGLSGSARFTQLALQIQDAPLASVEPVVVRFDTREIVFESARFGGSGSNMTIAGTKALADGAVNNLAIDGRVNLNLLNLVSKDTFFSGFADTSMRLSGPNATSRLSGTANIVNGTVATFLGSDRFTINRLQARVIFTSNQVQIEGATGYLGGGRFTGSGGGILDGLAIQAFRFSLDGNNVTVPLPENFMTTGDADLDITGIRQSPGENLQLTISGRVYARRSLYTQDIDLASIVSGRRDPVLASSGGGGPAPRFDLVIEGRDALIVRNNIADLTASVSLVLTGDANDPRISGRITANSGTIFFRNDRYVVQRGVLEFPPDTAIDPVINLQAEAEIAGYQVFINLSGPLKDSELLAANVRSSPALPQADIVSLITTGNLANTSGGIPTLAQTGINTAAEILTDAIINDPVRRATDRLFGLNVFEIDPLISGQQVNPSARLTVGRQINNNLRVTYATNLSADKNQVLAFEYRVSNKLSLVAQYEQRSLSNVTRNRDNFSFEVRFRKRF